MESRIDKYNDLGEITLSRTKKNEALYKEVNNAAIEEFNVNSNATVLDDNGQVIDVSKLRDMLDKKYREDTKKVNLGEASLTNTGGINLDETREYDINRVLNKAKEGIESDYEVDRFKKLRNTQIDILSGLSIEKKATSEEESSKLRELIDTINLKETIAKEGLDPLDILSDLKGDDDNTKVMGAVTKEELIKTKEAPEINVKTKINIDKNEREEKSNTVDKTMFTATNTFTQSDFDDFNDLKEEVASNKIVIKLLIGIVIIVFIVGVLLILNKVLGLGLF